MVSDKKWADMMETCYTLMYAEAEPPTTLEKLIVSGEGRTPSFFMKYYLDMDRQIEIINEVAKANRLSKDNKQTLSAGVLLGASPNSCRETWEKLQ